MNATSSKPPIPLRDALDIEDLCQNSPCDADIALGSFWLGSRRSFESRLVKVFKACVPTSEFEPHISRLCRFYANLVRQRTSEEGIDWVVRVLGSGETQVDAMRPQTLLVHVLCSILGARNGSDLFLRSQTRSPMRVVDRLAGAEALKARLRYVAQDLFIRPGRLAGNVLLLDDICNTGASTRVHASALKRFAGAQRVVTVNLAATMFSRGRDGRGMLQLDVSGLAEHPALGEVWTDGSGVVHTREDCPSAAKPAACDVRFMAERSARLCAECMASPAPEKKWWKVW